MFCPFVLGGELTRQVNKIKIMKTNIRISTDYYSQGAYSEFRDEINYLVNECIECYCEVKNNSLVNQVEEEKNYTSHKGQFKNKTIVEAKGYSQGEWQTYTLHHNLDENNDDLMRLVDELEKSFTHMNDYTVEKFESEEINGKVFNAEPHDYTNFSIRHIEFPDEDDVLKEYLEIYGKDFDECITDLK